MAQATAPVWSQNPPNPPVFSIDPNSPGVPDMTLNRHGTYFYSLEIGPLRMKSILGAPPVPTYRNEPGTMRMMTPEWLEPYYEFLVGVCEYPYEGQQKQAILDELMLCHRGPVLNNTWPFRALVWVERLDPLLKKLLAFTADCKDWKEAKEKKGNPPEEFDPEEAGAMIRAMFILGNQVTEKGKQHKAVVHFCFSLQRLGKIRAACLQLTAMEIGMPYDDRERDFWKGYPGFPKLDSEEDATGSPSSSSGGQPNSDAAGSTSSSSGQPDADSAGSPSSSSGQSEADAAVSTSSLSSAQPEVDVAVSPSSSSVEPNGATLRVNSGAKVGNLPEAGKLEDRVFFTIPGSLHKAPAEMQREACPSQLIEKGKQVTDAMTSLPGGGPSSSSSFSSTSKMVLRSAKRSHHNVGSDESEGGQQDTTNVKRRRNNSSPNLASDNYADAGFPSALQG
ncbi:hypothetical protein B0H63DRAFT_451159 [Podospora didyma]|uniref:Uncharacterized protein n=1 Tax=Podospora didyma TaxID=330526 RepID=A0AAE0NI41_9PEZI|nr:hypothetical protein B0H63DRAFT_451159 [Podospora didyma]